MQFPSLLKSSTHVQESWIPGKRMLTSILQKDGAALCHRQKDGSLSSASLTPLGYQKDNMKTEAASQLDIY